MAVKMVATTRVLDWTYHVVNQTLTGTNEGGAGVAYVVSITLQKLRTRQVPEPSQLDTLVRTALAVKREPHDLACFLASETECAIHVEAGLLGSAGTFHVRAGF